MFLFQSEVEDCLKRIQSHRGVFGVIVVNAEGECMFLVAELKIDDRFDTFRHGII
jgi:hypothetical protein